MKKQPGHYLLESLENQAAKKLRIEKIKLTILVPLCVFLTGVFIIMVVLASTPLR